MNCVAIETVFATLITVTFSLLLRRSLSDTVMVLALLVLPWFRHLCKHGTRRFDAKLDWVTPQQLFKRGILHYCFSFYLLYQWVSWGNCHLPSKHASEC